MPKAKALIVGLMSLFCITTLLHATDYYVDPAAGDDSNSGLTAGDAWRTVTHSLGAVSGTEEAPVVLHLESGTYSASENGESFPLQMKSYVSLFGEGANTVILDAEGNSYHVINSAGVSDVTIDSVTITGGYADGSGTDAKGGGILCAVCSGVVIQYCTVTGNSAWLGAGICCDVRCEAWIEGCLISDNESLPDSEGYSYGGGIGIDQSSPTVVHCTIEYNSATFGGGVDCYDSSSRIASCYVADNTAVPDSTGYSMGGGIRVRDASPTIESCTFERNFGSRGGGMQTSYSEPVIADCRFYSNEADSGGCIHIWEGAGSITGCEFIDNFASWGGGISANSYVSTIFNCLFASNYAQSSGGAMYIDGQAEPSIGNVTMNGNSAGYAGGAFIIFGSSAVSVRDSILWSNGDGPYVAEGSLDIEYCCVSGESENPLFVSGPLGDHYLSCRAAGQGDDSPCIDAGHDSAEELGLNLMTTRTDCAGDTGAVDLGYHYPAEEAGELTVSCYLNDSQFAPGDTLTAFIELDNTAEEVSVDIYVVLVMPDGAVISFTEGSFAVGIYPWFAGIALSQGFSSGTAAVFETPVPGGADGDYFYAAALTDAGTMSYAAGPEFYPFSIQTP